MGERWGREGRGGRGGGKGGERGYWLRRRGFFSGGQRCHEGMMRRAPEAAVREGASEVGERGEGER